GDHRTDHRTRRVSDGRAHAVPEFPHHQNQSRAPMPLANVHGHHHTGRAANGENHHAPRANNPQALAASTDPNETTPGAIHHKYASPRCGPRMAAPRRDESAPPSRLRHPGAISKNGTNGGSILLVVLRGG